MSGAMEDDAFMKAFAARARARAAEQRALEEPTHEHDSSVSLIADALEEQARREPTTKSPRAIERVRARRPAVVWLAAASLPVLAAAASVLIFVRAERHAVGSAPAVYVASVSGHVETERGGADDVAFTTLQARPDAIQEVILRPERRSQTAVVAKVLVVRSGVAEPSAVETELSDSGVVRFAIPGASLLGASEVRVVIAPPGEITAAVEAARTGAPATKGDVVVVRVPVERAAAPRR